MLPQIIFDSSKQSLYLSFSPPPRSSLMLVANFSAQTSACKGAGWGPAQGTGVTVGSLPSPVAKGCLCPKTVPNWGLTLTAAHRAPVSKPASRRHSGRCGARLLRPSCPAAACACRCQDKGQAPHWHAADLCIISSTQCATAGVSQSGAAGESRMQLLLPPGILQLGQGKPCFRIGAKCVGLTLLPVDGDEYGWPCCEGTAAHSQHVHEFVKAGVCPSSAVPSG